jgi:hypothetical protein
VIRGDEEASTDLARSPEPVRRLFRIFEYAGAQYLAAAFPRDEEPVMLRERVKRGPISDPIEIDRVAAAITDLLARVPEADLPSAILLPTSGLLATRRTDGHGEGRRGFAVSLLTGGVAVPTLSTAEIRSFNGRISDQEIASFFAACEGRASNLGQGGLIQSTASQCEFSLPGRPKLERFFREYVIDPSLDRARYESLGVRMPNGILLYGPTGSGKSYTVEKLRRALGWSAYEIDLGAMGSPYIHQTSVALRRAFEEAKAAAPSLVVLEEIDALATARGPTSHDHKVEEVTELLKLVERAAQNRILVMATTNRRDALDPAILRRGRFDHAIEVGYPEADEVVIALEQMLANRPHAMMPNLADVANRLANRPMSDIEWVVNEAARRTAQARRPEISEFDLLAAIARLG